MYGYTYLTYDTKRDMFYVGQHKSKAYDPKYLGSGIKLRRVIKLRRDTLRNYMLEQCDNRESLNESEIRWIKYFRDEMGDDKCYNVSDGGDGGSFGQLVNAKRSETLKGRIITDEHRKKIGAALKGKHHSTDSIRKGVETRIKHGNYTHTDETKAKLSKAGKNRHPSAETRSKLSESLKRAFANPKITEKRRNNAPCKEVYQYTLSKELVSRYRSVMEAHRQTGFNAGHICSCCNGSHNGIGYNFIWSYTPINNTRTLF